MEGLRGWPPVPRGSWWSRGEPVKSFHGLRWEGREARRLRLKRKPIIGLVGGIGSGKSTVARLLAECGAAVIDSDELNRQQLQSPEVIETLVSWWGEKVRRKEDGRGSSGLDKEQIARIIFKDAGQRRRLERFVHPRIGRERDRMIAAYEHDPTVGLIVVDSPLLLESGSDQSCDQVVFVDADDSVRLERVTQGRGWSAEDWKSREKSQIALDKKRSRADHVVVNNSSDLAQLRTAVQILYRKLVQGES